MGRGGRRSKAHGRGVRRDKFTTSVVIKEARVGIFDPCKKPTKQSEAAL